MKSTTKKILVSVMLVFFIVGAFAYLPLTKALTYKLTVSGLSILDSNDNPVILRGVMNNLLVSESGGFPVANIVSHIQVLASEGCNYYRIANIPWSQMLTSDNTVSNVAGDYSATWLAYIDAIASACATYHVYFSIDYEGIAFAASYGFSVPSFLTGTYGLTSSMSNFEIQFFNTGNSAYNVARTAFVNTEEFFINRYSSNPFYIVASWCEPYNTNTIFNANDNSTSGTFLTTQSGRYAAWANAFVTTVDSATGYNGVFVIDDPWVNDFYTTTKGTINTGEGIVIDAHAYEVGGVSNGWNGNFAEFTTNYINRFITEYRTNMGLPLVIGEWSFVDDNMTDSDIINDASQGGTSPNWLIVLQNMITLFNTDNIVGETWYDDRSLYTQVGEQNANLPVSTGYSGAVSFSLAQSNSIYGIIFQGATQIGSSSPTPTPTPSPTPTASPTATPQPTNNNIGAFIGEMPSDAQLVFVGGLLLLALVGLGVAVQKHRKY